MKKSILFLLCYLCTVIIVCAQDSINPISEEDYFKASKNRFATELNINPFQGKLSLNNALNQIKVRYFVSNAVALRLALACDVNNKSINNSNAYGSNPYDVKEKKKTSTIGLNFGAEKHFRGTKRLSPYIGTELAFAVKSSSHTIDDDDSNVEIKGVWRNMTFQQTSSSSSSYYYSYEERAYTKIGLNVLAGFDFYLAKNFYFGYELNFGLSNTVYKDIEVTMRSKSPSFNNPIIKPSPDTQDEDEKEFSFGPNLINGIRLGFVF